MSILDESFPAGRFAVVDLETTGLTPAIDRIVEIAILHVDGPTEIRLVLDTLVNPRRRMAGTEIHGITDDEVRHAPTFADIAPFVARALSGRVMVAHNVYFDMRFLANELGLSGFVVDFPHVCTMYLPPMLGIGEKRCLDDACREHGISRSHAHSAGADAAASAALLTGFLPKSAALGVMTYGDLAKRKKYKFVDSFRFKPLDAPEPVARPSLLSRGSTQSHYIREADGVLEHRRWVRRYYDVLVTAISDLELTDAEASELKDIARHGSLRAEEIRAAHSRVYAAFINQYLDDAVIDEDERCVLSSVWESLRSLGWAPGQ